VEKERKKMVRTSRIREIKSFDASMVLWDIWSYVPQCIADVV